MSDATPPSPGRRFALRIVRVALWPAARLSPSSSWARLYHRIGALGDPREPTPSARKRARVSPPLATLAVLLGAALVLWLHDVLRRPAPPPPALAPAQIVAPR